MKMSKLSIKNISYNFLEINLILLLTKENPFLEVIKSNDETRKGVCFVWIIQSILTLISR